LVASHEQCKKSVQAGSRDVAIAVPSLRTQNGANNMHHTYKVGDRVKVALPMDLEPTTPGTIVKVATESNGAFPYDVRLDDGRVEHQLSDCALAPEA
jgi:hypothetical protein